jgi:hypothetical protein
VSYYGLGLSAGVAVCWMDSLEQTHLAGLSTSGLSSCMLIGVQASQRDDLNFNQIQDQIQSDQLDDENQPHTFNQGFPYGPSRNLGQNHESTLNFKIRETIQNSK